MSEKVTFQELIESIAGQTDNSKQFTHDFLKDFVAVINDGLESDGTVNIAGFGKFKLRPMDEREGYNPQTGEKITIPAHNKVIFKPYKDLRELVNAPYAHLEAELLDDETDTKSTDSRDEESQESASSSSSESEESEQELSPEKTEKAPWKQALEDTTDDDFEPEYPLNTEAEEKEDLGFQFDDQEDDFDDGDIVEYSPHVEMGNKRERMTESPSSNADEETDKQKTTGADGLNDPEPPAADDKETLLNEQAQPAETAGEIKTDSSSSEDEDAGKSHSDEPQQVSSAPSYQKPEQQDSSSRNRIWLVAAACIILLIAAGAWYVASLSDSRSQNTLALNSASSADDRQQQQDPLSSSGQTTPSVSSPSNLQGSGSAARPAQNQQSQHSTSTRQVITEGQTLWSLADQQYDNPYLWPWIYDENKSSINNPDLIRAGKSLALPIPGGVAGGLSSNDSLQVAMGYVETYRWYKNQGYEKAKYYLYAARIYKGSVFDHTDVNIDDADLAFANRAR